MFFKIKLSVYLLLMSVALFLFSPIIFATTQINASSITGYWQTIDGKTKKPSSIIYVHQKGQWVFGKIVKTFSLPDESKSKVCNHCTGSQKNKPILGLTIIKNMTCTADVCHGGTILDPRSGSVYHANMRLIDAGQQMQVHGYIGIALFGKTVIWHKVSHA